MTTMDLRALVVDDEQLARDELCFLLDQTRRRRGRRPGGQRHRGGRGAGSAPTRRRLPRHPDARPDRLRGGASRGRHGPAVATSCSSRRSTSTPSRRSRSTRSTTCSSRSRARAPRAGRSSASRRRLGRRGPAERAPREDRQTGRRPAAAPGPGRRQGRRTVPAGPGRRSDLRVAEWGYDIYSDGTGRRDVATTGRSTNCRRASTPRCSGGCIGRISSTSTRSRR